MSNEVTIPYVAINLPRSTDRWAKLQRRADEAKITLTAIEAVDGRTIPEAEWQDFDIKRFRRICGRHPYPGEYGCFQSHVKAWRTMIDNNAESAVIMEDDAQINAQLPQIAAELTKRYGNNQPMLIKLCAHRASVFLSRDQPILDYAIGQSLFGPVGGGNLYWLNKSAAEHLLAARHHCDLPVDIFLEQSWLTGVQSGQLWPNPFAIPPKVGTTINDIEDAKYKKFPALFRLPTLAFRTGQFVQRLAHVTGTRSFSPKP